MAKNAEKKGLGAREKQIIYILVGLILVALAYFLGFSKFNETREVLVAENEKLQAEVDELNKMAARRAEVEADTETKRAAVLDIYKNYPVALRTQNLIDYFDKIEKQIKNLDFTTENFTQNMIFFQNGAVLESEISSTELPDAVSANAEEESTEGTEETAVVLDENGLPAEVTGYHSSVAVNYTTNYDDLQKIITYINQYPQRTTIRDINISAPEGAKTISCSMTVNLYSIGGIEGAYDDLTFPEVQIGKNNIFK